jgi:tetratricopeptide (TPR) repeat protein
MAMAVAAPPAVPVSAPMLAQMILLACGGAMREPPPPAAAIGIARCPDRADCIGSCAADSVRTLTVRRARSAARDGDWNAAARQWREALLIDEHLGADWLAMADVLMNAERHREAAAAYQRAIQLDARVRERGTRGVARAYARMGDDRQAVRWLEQAIQLGARPAELLGDESFRRYRDEPRLRGAPRRQVDRHGGDDARRESAST